MQLSDIVFPPACNNGFTSYTVQCKQDLICANMCSQKRYVTVVTLKFKCIQHLVNKWFRFSKNKCFFTDRFLSKADVILSKKFSHDTCKQTFI